MDLQTIFWIIYGIGFVVAFIPCSRWCLVHMFDNERDSEAIIMAIACGGFCVAPLWPLLIPGFWAYKVIQMDSKR